MHDLDRRSFLRQSTVAGAGLFTAGAVQTLTARDALARKLEGKSPYGPVRPMRDRTTGREILALPNGFKYATFGAIGSTMSDGNPTPLALDGMAAFDHPSARRRHVVRLIRNHEDRNAKNAGSNRPKPGEDVYDQQAGGGTSTLDFDVRKMELLQDFISLKGTIVNCAGGYTLGQTGWLTGEETTEIRDGIKHGYTYFVPVDRDRGEGVRSDPIVPMGRFAHEAAATDDRTGIVYQTEDAGSGRGSGFYRYIPNVRTNLDAGGRLEMLAVTGNDRIDLRQGQRIGDTRPVRWVAITTVDPADNAAANSVFQQGFAQGGAKFNRLEGCWWDGRRSIFFASTSGGDVKNGDVNTADGFREGFGQIWQYRAEGFGGGTLTLVYESTGSEALDSPDNLCVTPRGGLILCEDDASDDEDTNPANPSIEDVNRLIGFSRNGGVFEFAVNILNNSEFAGATFSPDGKVLFVNIFGSSRFETDMNTMNEGMTIAIRGPWARGPL